MKRLWIVFSALFLGLVLAGWGDNFSTVNKSFPLIGGTEVLRNVYDDQQDTVYIKVDKPLLGEEDAAIAEIMTKKKQWKQRFPAKKVVTMSIVTGAWGGHGHLFIIGLLIHYE